VNYNEIKERLRGGEILRNIEIGPQLACQFFPMDEKARGQEKDNRPIDRTHVKRMAGIIGRDEYNPLIATPLCFSPNDIRLLMGHHRLLALQHPDALGKTIRVDMIPNVTNLRGDDEGKGSSLADKMFKAGVANPKVVAATVKQMSRGVCPDRPSPQMDFYYVNKEMVDEHLFKAQSWLNELHVAGNRPIRADYLAFARSVAVKHYPAEMVDNFLRAAVIGEGGAGSTTAETYHELAQRSKQKKFTATKAVELLLKMLSKSITGRKRNILKATPRRDLVPA